MLSEMVIFLSCSSVMGSFRWAWAGLPHGCLDTQPVERGAHLAAGGDAIGVEFVDRLKDHRLGGGRLVTHVATFMRGGKVMSPGRDLADVG